MRAANRLDVIALSTNRNDQPACNAVVNIYARTRLQIELVSQFEAPLRAGAAFAIDINANVLQGNITTSRSLARLVAPTTDLQATVANLTAKQVPAISKLEGSKALKFDPALVLATLEKRSAKIGRLRNEELPVEIHGDMAMPIRILKTDVPGAYYIGVYVEGAYCPLHAHPYGAAPDMQHHDEPVPAGGTCDPDCAVEPFTRVLTTMVAVPTQRPRRAQPTKRGTTRRL